MIENEERLKELEIRFSHQARQIDELSKELLGCFRRIDQLERENRRVGEMLRGLGPDMTESPDE